MIRTLVVLIFILNAGISQAFPNARFRHITVEDGLSHSTVYSILQDQQGYMWFGTQDGGLNRYDGHSFKIFRHDVSDSTSLPSNNISGFMLQDSSGFIWLGTWGGGLVKFDPMTEKCAVFKHDPADSASLSHNRIQSGQITRNGQLWIGTAGGGLNKLSWIIDGNGQSRAIFTHYQNNPQDARSLSNNRIWC